MNSKTLYIAYGSNLNLPQMASRCPTAKVVGASTLKDYELLFRGDRHGSVATVEPLKGSCVPVLLWSLKEKDQHALDRYEGYPYFYWKETLIIELNGKPVHAMIYIMNEGHPFGAPTDFYFNTIMDGYKSAGFDTEFLINAAHKSILLAREQQEPDPAIDDHHCLKWW